jgi:anti-sigma factor RsiW
MNRNCKKIEEYLVDYLYQELAAKKTLEVEKHLRSCTQCTQTLESWRAIHRAYQRSTEEPQVASYTKQKILAVAEEELLRSPSWNERFLWGLKIATVPIAIFVLVLFLNAQKDPEVEMTKAAPEPAPRRMAARQDAPVPLPVPSAAAPDAGEHKQAELESQASRKVEAPKLKDQSYSDRNEEVSAKEDVRALGSVGEEAPPPSPPAAEGPPMDAVSNMERDASQVKVKVASPQQKAASITAVSKKAEEPLEKAQEQFRSKNVKEGQNLLRQAISSDDEKSLAGKLHEQGSTYQNQGEYGLAITHYENVQSNYKDYSRMDDVLLRLGDSYAEVGEFNKAVNVYRQVSPSQRKIAVERIQRLQKKREAQQQLESLGYISEPKKND